MPIPPLPSLLVPLAGGVLVGLSVALAFVALGRVAGVSGILGGLLDAPRVANADRSFRLTFLGGLLVGGIVLAAFAPSVFHASTASLPRVVIGGLLVGFGTRLANGCTSGHGVCGISRLSPRSLLATVTFLGTGMITVALFRAATGVAP